MGGLTADRWRRVESLCHAALARPAGERDEFLADACGDDQSLRDEVASLVAGAGGAASFMETPVGNVASRPSLIGRRLGGYRVDAPLGAGGMGEVYRAKDTRLGRDVAIKILPEAWAADAQRRMRFEREARAVAALNHPNICTIHDVGHDEGVHFLVMELVDGETLADRLAKGPLPFDEALAHAIEIADALDTAHRGGIVHRDLKPGNVMLARTGSGKSRTVQAKLLDFGLARRVDPGAAPWRPGRTEEGTITETGTVFGTLQYMAPEQIEGRAADARADIFAFGLLLYEMLTGRRPFEGASGAAVIAAILREDPPPVHPREVDRIVRRCLAKDPVRRYQSARDLLNDLEEIRQSLDSAQLPPGRAGRHFGGRSVAWLAVGLLVTIAIAGYAAWLRRSAQAPLRVERFQLQPPAGVEIAPSGANPVLAVSPDGRSVAFVGIERRINETALYLRSVGELEPKKIVRAGTAPFFSPDSRWLAFFAENALYKLPVGGGQAQRLCGVRNVLSVRGASWGDGDTIVFSLDKALWRVPATGGEPVALTHPTSNVRHYWPQVLPGGGAVVFTINQGFNDGWRRIGVLSLETGDVRAFPALSGTAPRYVPSGHLVYSRFGALHAVPFDLSRLEVRGVPAKILDSVTTFMGSGSVAFDVTRSGSLVYIPDPDPVPDFELVWLNRQGTVAPVFEERRPFGGAALDPDGRRIGLQIAHGLGETDLWIYEIDRGSWTRLTTGMAVAGGAPVWSSDGKWIFFTSFKSGEAEIFRMPSRGGEPEQLTFDVTVWKYAGSVSPDGSTLFFWKSLPSQGDLMTLRIEPRGTPEHVTNSPAFLEAWPRVSPDGRWIAYDSNESGRREIHVRPFSGPGEETRVSPSGGADPWWSRDGRELFYHRGAELWSAAVETTPQFRHHNPRVLFKADFLLEWPDGFLAPGGDRDRFLALRRAQQPGDRMLVYAPNWLEELKHALRQPR